MSKREMTALGYGPPELEAVMGPVMDYVDYLKAMADTIYGAFALSETDLDTRMEGVNMDKSIRASSASPSLWAENPLANKARIPDPVDPAPAPAFKVGDRVRLRDHVTDAILNKEASIGGHNRPHAGGVGTVLNCIPISGPKSTLNTSVDFGAGFGWWLKAEWLEPAPYDVITERTSSAGVPLGTFIRTGDTIHIAGGSGASFPAGTLREGDTVHMYATTGQVHLRVNMVGTIPAGPLHPDHITSLIKDAPANEYGDRTISADLGPPNYLAFTYQSAMAALAAGMPECAVLTAGSVSRRLVKRGGKPAWIGVDDAVGEYNTPSEMEHTYVINGATYAFVSAVAVGPAPSKAALPDMTPTHVLARRKPAARVVPTDLDIPGDPF